MQDCEFVKWWRGRYSASGKVHRSAAGRCFILCCTEYSGERYRPECSAVAATGVMLWERCIELRLIGVSGYAVLNTPANVTGRNVGGRCDRYSAAGTVHRSAAGRCFILCCTEYSGERHRPECSAVAATGILLRERCIEVRLVGVSYYTVRITPAVVAVGVPAVILTDWVGSCYT